MIKDVRKLFAGFVLLFVLLSVSKSRAIDYGFFNTNYITINDSDNPPTLATPYPSPITITGFSNQVVTKATVTLNGFSHDFPSDVDILLVGPQGQYAMLMSEVGGDQQYPVTNLTITLDDAAQGPLPINDPLYSGVFQPTARNPVLFFDFPPPAPSGNSNAVAALSVFNGTDPTGDWNLFVVDDTPENAGYISGGWTLLLSIAVPLEVNLTQTNAVISWPASARSVTLQSATNLSKAGAWTNVPVIPTQVAGQFVVTNQVLNGPNFFRLIGP